MSDLTVNILAYPGCALIGFSIGFLELLRVRILSWLPFAGMPFHVADDSESHAHINSLVLYVLLIGLFILSGVSTLISESASGPISWHGTKMGLIVLSLIAGEYAQMSLKHFMRETESPNRRAVLTESDFVEDVEAKRKADFLNSDYARQFASYEDYKASLQP